MPAPPRTTNTWMANGPATRSSTTRRIRAIRHPGTTQDLTGRLGFAYVNPALLLHEAHANR
jgi:hypothetical protein